MWKRQRIDFVKSYSLRYFHFNSYSIYFYFTINWSNFKFILIIFWLALTVVRVIENRIIFDWTRQNDKSVRLCLPHIPNKFKQHLKQIKLQEYSYICLQGVIKSMVLKKNPAK